MHTPLTRRDLLTHSAIGAALAAAALPIPFLEKTVSAQQTDSPAASGPFGFCLNTSTIRGYDLSIVEEIDVAAKAGYRAIEPWVPKIDAYVDKGGSLKDLNKRLRDSGLTVESAIGFAQWIVDEDDRRAKGMEVAKRDMDRLAQIGGKRVAASAAGAQDKGGIDLIKAGERYRALCELGDQFGVVPQVEVWGFSRTLTKLSQAVMVAVESGHPKACVLADIYHLYKGGSDFDGLRLLSADAMHVLHMNDYPADPPREKIGDGHRVYPGDGVAPLDEILRMVRDTGFRGWLSLELFNEGYWKQHDALTVAQTGLRKMQEAVQKALG
jgi:2-keto-myo-inositol isomerase